MKCKICGTRNKNSSTNCKFCGYDMKESVSYNNSSISDTYSYDKSSSENKVYTINEDYTKNNSKFYNSFNSSINGYNINSKIIKIFIILFAIFFFATFIITFSSFFLFSNIIEKSFESMDKFETVGILSGFENCYNEDSIELCNAIYEYVVDDEVYTYMSDDFIEKEDAGATINIIYNQDNPTQTIVDGSYSIDLDEFDFEIFSIFDLISFFIPVVIFIIVIIKKVKKLGKKNSNTI